MISIYSCVERGERGGENAKEERKKVKKTISYASSLHVMHVCLIKIKLYIYLKLNEVLNVFISKEGERERLREIEQQHMSFYTYTGMFTFNVLEKYLFTYLFV